MFTSRPHDKQAKPLPLLSKLHRQRGSKHPSTPTAAVGNHFSHSCSLWQRLRLFGVDNGAPGCQNFTVCHNYSLRHLHRRLKRRRVSWLSVQSKLSEECLRFERGEMQTRKMGGRARTGTSFRTESGGCTQANSLGVLFSPARIGS